MWDKIKKFINKFYEDYILLKDIELLDDAYMELGMDEKMGHGSE